MQKFWEKLRGKLRSNKLGEKELEPKKEIEKEGEETRGGTLDKCISCGGKTQYDQFDHIDDRLFYIEGAGQLCPECFNLLYCCGR